MSKKISLQPIAGRAVKRIFVFLLVLSFLLAGRVPGARAAARILYAKPVVPGTGDCSSWASACGLPAALTNAVSGDQIWVAAGTYTPSITGNREEAFGLKEGVAIYGGFTGTETALDQRDWTANVVVLSGDLKGDDDGFNNNGENSYHVVTGANNATLDGVTVSGGNANGSELNGVGGGMFNYFSSTTLDNVTPTLTNVTFSGNSATKGGGGMFNNGYNINPTLTNVIFNRNTSVIDGGGMFNYGGASPRLTHVLFNGNTCTKASGGGMFNSSASNPTLIDVTFSGNAAYANGGGMFNYNGTSPALSNVTFSDNKASDSGGGMGNFSSSPILSNVTFTGNTASNGGGGMFNSNDSRPVLINVTFSSNRAKQGGGIFNSSYNGLASYPTVTNSILWGDSGGEIVNLASSVTVNFSDVQGGYPGTGNLDADPLLAPLGDYGGRVKTMAFLPSSPVIDATSSNCPLTDARGFKRSSPACDMGAFELEDFILSKTSGDNQSVALYSTIARPLCLAVTAQIPGRPVDGQIVTFTPPTSGPSATLTGSPAMITNGAACVSGRANGIAGGPYKITASLTGAASITFSLNNYIPFYLYGSYIYFPIINRDK